MPRVPITTMGYQCGICGHEWLPRTGVRLPKACPKCYSPRWDSPRSKSTMTYEEFCQKVQNVLHDERRPMTWTEVRTKAKLPQLFPNNQWVRRMETDTHLLRKRDQRGIIMWSMAGNEGQAR